MPPTNSDAHGKSLAVGDHVFIPARISAIATDGSVTLVPDHPRLSARQAHAAAEAEWQEKFGAHTEPSAKTLAANPCPQLTPGGSTLTGLDAGQVEFHCH
jgi:hypothetical protein